MAVRVVIAGESSCDLYAQACMIAGHLSQNLPQFCFEPIEKSVLEWKLWLSRINQKNKWHHCGSPLVWKELLMKGSKPYYIGGASEFFEYCNSYYNFKLFCAEEKFKDILEHVNQYQNNIQKDKKEIAGHNNSKNERSKMDFTICISGARHPLTMHIISGLLDMSSEKFNGKSISKIFIFDQQCNKDFLEYIERECSYIRTNYSTKVLKCVPKIGMALTSSDLFLILDHIPLDDITSIGDWLYANKKIMKELALMINASASSKLRILLLNLGPACYNATVLAKNVSCIYRQNIAVATSDLALEVLPLIAEIAEVPMRNIFCPPVWGFVGVNHIVDIRNTVHRYNTFEPYNRYTKVKNSTLNIGSLTPEMRTMEYLLFFDDTLWKKVVEGKNQFKGGLFNINKAIAVLDVVKMWLFNENPSDIICLGILCNGSFDLKFEGVFSQPVRLIDKEWTPASEYMLPKDPHIRLPYLEQMAEFVIMLKRNDLPKLNSYIP